MKSPQDTNPQSWDRFFAASANNAAWTLVETAAAEVDRRELLNAAHAAAWHWRRVGSELHQMRSLLLLAIAHAHAGIGSNALAYADEVRAYFLSNANTPDFEIAFTHVAHAYAAAAAGEIESHRRAYASAVEAMAAIANEQDRDVVQRVFRHVPPP